MRTSRRELASEHNAALLIAAIEAKHPGFADYVRAHGASAAAEKLLKITVHVSTDVRSTCGVAGSSDIERRAVTVASSPNEARMGFTILHEIGHIEGADDIAFQTALEDSQSIGEAIELNRAEEDACEVFAANVLLPPELVKNVMATHKLTAGGLLALQQTAGGRASLAACAVAWAHQLPSDGYVAILDADGSMQFAGRSGDVLTVKYGADQSETELWRRATGRNSWRGRSQFAFPSGSLTQSFEIDAIGTTTGGIVAVAVSDSPDWPVPFRRPEPERLADRLIDAHCAECVTEFQASVRCSDCGQPRHATCGRCACEVFVARGSRTCEICNLTLPDRCFPIPSQDVCESCS